MMAQAGGDFDTDAVEMDPGVDLIDAALSRMSSVDRFSTAGISTAAQPSAPVLLNSLSPATQPGAPKTDYNGIGAQMMRDFRSALRDTNVMKPTEKLKVSQGATNAESNHREGHAKIDDARQRIQQLHSMKDQILLQTAADPSQKGAGSGLMGMVMKDVVVGGAMSVVSPGAGTLYAGVSMAKSLMQSPVGLRSLEGLGTFSQAAQAAPSQFAVTPTRGHAKGRAVDFGYGASESSPAPSQAVWKTLQNGPGFGKPPGSFDYIGERAETTSSQLEGMTSLRLEKMIDESNTVRLLNGQKNDGELVENIHAARVKLGLGPKTEQNVNIFVAASNNPIAAPAPAP